MLYRPAFCCNCGEKIVREEWRLWTSRRFCALCSTEHQGIDLLPKIVVAAGILGLITGAAMFFKKPGIASEPSTFSAKQSKPNLKPAALSSSNTHPLANSGTITSEGSRNVGTPVTQQSEQPQREKRTSDESVYFCGAVTKKGTPCTRRVKTKRFCWQHAKSGQIAPARF